MGATNHITTKWLGNMAFESNNPSGHNFKIDIAKEDGGDGSGMRPKALMLSSLAGCSGLDVASLMKKMKLEVDEFTIETIANLTDEHPKFYDKVTIEYHFHGANLEEKKLQRAVDLSIEKYCGVMEMFRQFAELKIETIFHQK
jgi:putative redox protein